MKTYLGLLLLAISVQAQKVLQLQPPLPAGPFPAQRVPIPQRPLQAAPFQIHTDNQDVSMDNEDDQEMTTPYNVPDVSKEAPIRSMVKKRTRTPMPPTFQVSTMGPSEEESPNEGQPDMETTTLSEMARLTKGLKFDCSDQAPGYYANVDTGCRIWHQCLGAIRYDNICPVLTLFDQEFFTCVYATDTNCADAPKYYEKNKDLYKPVSQTTPRRRKLRRRKPTTQQPLDYDFDSRLTPVVGSPNH